MKIILVQFYLNAFTLRILYVCQAYIFLFTPLISSGLFHKQKTCEHEVTLYKKPLFEFNS